MAKPEWGTKRLCQSCGAKFYDMLREPIVCPKCETTFEMEVKQRKTRAPRAQSAAVVAAPVEAKKPEFADNVEALEVEATDEIEDDDEDGLDDVGIGAGAS